MAKLTLFAAAAQAGQIPLMILGVLMTVVSVYYYLRIPVLMYMRDPEDDEIRSETSTGEIVVLAVCVVCVLFLGIYPNGGDLPVLDWARESVKLFFPA